jgi:hypothetical protein
VEPEGTHPGRGAHRVREASRRGDKLHLFKDRRILESAGQHKASRRPRKDESRGAASLGRYLLRGRVRAIAAGRGVGGGGRRPVGLDPEFSAALRGFGYQESSEDTELLAARRPNSARTQDAPRPFARRVTPEPPPPPPLAAHDADHV